MTIEINNIDQLIQAYKDDVINTKQLIKLLEKQSKHIAIWIDADGYNETKETTLKGLQEYKKHLEDGNEMPLFFLN